MGVSCAFFSVLDARKLDPLVLHRAGRAPSHECTRAARKFSQNFLTLSTESQGSTCEVLASKFDSYRVGPYSTQETKFTWKCGTCQSCWLVNFFWLLPSADTQRPDDARLHGRCFTHFTRRPAVAVMTLLLLCAEGGSCLFACVLDVWRVCRLWRLFVW